MNRPLDPRGLLAKPVTVRARCIVCRATRDIGPGEVPKGQVPSCHVCSNPMVAVSAVIPAQPRR